MTMAADPILIVDDNPANLKVARFALESEGYDVRTAADGEEAVLILREFRPRLILMDIQLPGVDGLELTRRLKADPVTQEIVIVAVTAYAMKGDREKALGAGCDGYITKPLDPIQLPFQIGEYLGRPYSPAVVAATAAIPTTAQMPSTNAAPVGKSAGSILVVEDNPTTRKMFRVALESAGYEVFEAGDAGTALDMVGRRPPDLVIQDLILPDMDGLELVRSLRKQLGDAPVPIFCVSGFLSKLDEARAVKGGFSAVLVKPVDPIHLLDLVKAHLVATPSASEVLGSGQRILLVDDDPLQLKLAHAWLTSSGFNVLTATDGTSALEMARRERPDAILSDVLMPGMDGFGLCLAIRGDREIENIPVLLASSSYVEEADRVLAARVGASALVSKTEGLEAVTRALGAGLRAPPPPPPSDSIEALRDEHAKRALWQLERQVQQNARLAQRSTLQAAQLAVLAGVAEALARNRVLNGVLGDVLASCLDMAGISKGVLYIAETDGRLALKHQIGFSETDLPRLRRIFDCEEVIRDIARRGRVVPIPSASIPAHLAQRLIVETGATSLLLVPVSWGETIYGATLLGARTADITGEDAVAFARVLGAQMGQAIGLAHAFASLAASEQRYRTLTENANDAICILTADGLIREANRRFTEILGFPPDRLVGRHFKDFVTPGREYHDGQGRTPPDEVRKADGGVVLMEFSNTSVEVEEERLVLVVGRDVTERVQSQLRRDQLEYEQRRTREELLRSELAATEARAARDVAEAKAALTEELQYKNKELEAFSYSVSHDLRAPLRHIDGFSLALLKDYADRLDDAGKNHLRHVRESAQRMGALIDGLLALARITRGEFRRQHVDLSSLAREVAAQLQRQNSEPPRPVELVIQDGLAAEGDSRLLRAVLENLLGNAWKFTRKRHGARIEFGCSIQDGQRAFFVRDNGAGFDMAYGKKLFGAFQRLHAASEYEGHGIGLATVQRIVDRHGGRIWAEGEVGVGATFYFTIREGEHRP
jgi:PAS domain S-box-containing protein